MKKLIVDIDNTICVTTNGEKYIAPLYNSLITDGLKINSFLSSNNNFSLCGTPTEYEINKFF